MHVTIGIHGKVTVKTTEHKGQKGKFPAFTGLRITDSRGQEVSMHIDASQIKTIVFALINSERLHLDACNLPQLNNQGEIADAELVDDGGLSGLPLFEVANVGGPEGPVTMAATMTSEWVAIMMGVDIDKLECVRIGESLTWQCGMKTWSAKRVK